MDSAASRNHLTLYGAGFCATQHSGQYSLPAYDLCISIIARADTVSVSDIVTEFVTAKDSGKAFLEFQRVNVHFHLAAFRPIIYTVCMLHVVITPQSSHFATL